MLTSLVSFSGSSLGFVLCARTLIDWVISTLWLDATGRFEIEEVGDLASVHKVTEDRIIDFGKCCDTRLVKQRFVLPAYGSLQL